MRRILKANGDTDTEEAAEASGGTIILATFVGNSDLFELPELPAFSKGVQYEISEAVARQLRHRDDWRIVEAEAGSEDDERETVVEVDTAPQLTDADRQPAIPVAVNTPQESE